MSQYWLVKSEPDECGIDDFVGKSGASIRWDGVRNYQARNFLAQMEVGDWVYLYHSSCRHIGVAGALRVTRSSYPDPLQFQPDSSYYDPKANSEDPRWVSVDLTLHQGTTVAPLVPLKVLRGLEAMQDSLLLTRPRLSVMPITPEQWRAIERVRVGRNP